MIDKMTNPAAAASAYATTAKTGGAMDGNKAGGVSFGDLMKSGISSSINTMHRGEQMSARAVTGEASLPDVVQAVNAAELTLQTVTAIRDRLVSAYQELMRTQI